MHLHPLQSLRPRHPRLDDATVRNTAGSYAEGVAAEVLLPREAFATHGTGEGSLAGVGADVSLHDSLLLGRVRAERALVEFNWYYQAITCRGRQRPRVHT